MLLFSRRLFLIKLVVVGVGPGDPELITLKALKAIEKANLVLVPTSGTGKDSVADTIIRSHLPNLKSVPIVFPMTRDEKTRDSKLHEQLEDLRPHWSDAENVVLPVIGDSALYATGAYLYAAWKHLSPHIELELIPGISAHSLTASRVGRFLALAEAVLSIVPGTASTASIEKDLCAASSVALYKPSALGGDLPRIIDAAGPWTMMIRVDRAGLPDERIFEGREALAPAEEYLSTLLLWR